MEARLIAALIMTPFALAFIYAGIHEFMRYKSEGGTTYGLVYNDETGTTHVTGIPDEAEAYDPDDYDPNSYNDPEISSRTDDEEPDAVDEDGNLIEVVEIVENDPEDHATAETAETETKDEDKDGDEVRRS
ncbi:hypothetical protein RM543_13950 [Roseicyclus sp. F158]|uniref:Uncharacterized protein n=1 Tax=Tropicimonas omnivorans TaxID=3075590 RepID=A0ABU3DJC4_9RHOB|nr:hypothetical protein [Roseicyclus sp. F158]MDT0683790.1 hypothetical protein [Roseicyclus sp. F158]